MSTHADASAETLEVTPDAMPLLPAEFHAKMSKALREGEATTEDVVNRIIGYARVDSEPIPPRDVTRVMEGLREAGVR